MAVVCAGLSVLAAPVARAQGTPAGTRIQAWATVTFEAGSQSYTISSDTVEYIVAQVAGADVEPPRVVTGALGGAVVLPHTLANVGNGPDSFAVAAVSVRGWSVSIHHDVNGDGLLDAADSVVSSPLPVGYAGRANLLVRVAVPNLRSVVGTSDSVRLTAISRFDPTVRDQLDDRLDVPNTTLAISVAKTVDRTTAMPGDVIGYTLRYDASGTGVVSAFQLEDTVPAGTSYVPGTMRRNGVSLTDASGDDAGAILPGGNGVVQVDLGPVAAGASGIVTFQVRADPGPQRVVSNVGHGIFTWGASTDTAHTNAVQTSVSAQQLSLVKTLVGPVQALVGEEVSYTLRYVNVAGIVATSAVLTDTLPAGLVFARAVPAPSVAGSLLTWSLGDLAPGDSGVIGLVVRVSSAVRDTLRVRNAASLTAANAAAQAAIAPQVALIGPPSAAVALDLSAGVLEVGVGEVIPYTIVVRNTGVLPVTNLRIDHRVPVGGRYAVGTAVGADSAWSSGDHVFFTSGAALGPGEARTVRFTIALTSAPGAVAEARASAAASAGGATAVSQEAVAWVQVRRAWPMETRVAIGKVWVDTDGDGRQGPGDPGLAGIDVWSDDGDIASTDASGNFSFTNLPPGAHAFRLDPLSVPEGYRVVSDEVRLIEASGWTTPSVNFRLVRVTARLEAVRRLTEVRFTAVRLSEPRDSAALYASAHRLPAPRRPAVRYEVELHPPVNFPRDALVSFTPVADSAVVYVDGALFTRYSWIDNMVIPIPPARAGADIQIVAWSSERTDSAMMRVRTGATLSSVRAVVHNPRQMVTLAMWVPASVATLPQADSAVAGDVLELALAPARASWPEVAYLLPPGWRAVPGSVRVGGRGATGPDPAVARSGSGGAALRWRFVGAEPAPIALRIAREQVGPVVAETVFVRAARTPAERAAERRASLVRGPGIEIFAPADGAVLPSDRVYLGVKGEAGARVVLYDGATRVDTALIRMDGQHDFIALPLARGPHRLRVQMQNSSGQERWDSIAVHVTGLPARFEVPSRLTLVGDGRTVAVASVRVLDRWGVPVAQPAFVTAVARGAEVVGRDADPSSVGLQLLSTASGRLAVALRPGRDVGMGTLELKSGDSRAQVPIEVLPEVRPLTVVGSGLVGVGASPDAYGAITAQGRVDERTAVTLSLHSRRLDADHNAFGRTHDPLAESQYPILGDASLARSRSAAHTRFSAKLERGFDWVSFGDVTSSDFASGLTLAPYRRAVTGVASHVTTGAVTWSGFGSITTQALRQLQLRGAGTSGPYDLGADVLPGTDYLRIETRALDNPERAIVTQALTRFVDYQIDYARGVVLFKQPVPSADVNGNPVFIVATYEAAAGGAQGLVGGARAALDARGFFGSPRLDSLRIGVTAVTAQQSSDAYRLIGADVRVLRIGALDIGAEIAYAAQADSAGVATTAKVSYSPLDGALSLGASYLSVGRAFTNPSNVALRPGTAALDLRGLGRWGASTIRLEHSRQRFELDGVDRRHTRFGIVQAVGPRVALDVGVASDHVEGGVGGAASVGELKATWRRSQALELWAGARHHIQQSGSLVLPDYWGFGSAYRMSPAVTLEGAHRFVTLPNAAGGYAVSDLGVRASVLPGTQAWGSYQLAGVAEGARNAALVGLNNRFRLTPVLAANFLFERRFGVDRAPISDPVRALPFLQAEDDYWSASAGLELGPERGAYRLSARGEYRDGVLQSSRLATVAGDIAFDASLALLTRQEFLHNERSGAALSRRVASLWGLAFRPAHSDRLNLLAKFQWTDERNPIGGGVLVPEGAERRLIVAAEAIWAPGPLAELGARYAVRRTQAARADANGTTQPLTSWADYVGARARVDVAPWLALQSDARMLVEHAGGARRWDLAPAFVLRFASWLEVASGYRFGNLADPDFSVRGGHGVFVTFQASLTEKGFPTAASFWRSRF